MEAGSAPSSERGHRWFAAWYDRLNASWERKQGAVLRRALLAGLSGDVLEIGAGTGLNFEHYPADVRVVALEPDPHMAQRARARLRPNIDLQQAPAERLPLADASFDAAVSTLVLCTVSDQAASLAQIRRVLKPGGEFRFLEHVRPGGVAGRLTDLVQPAYGWLSAGCHMNRNTEQALHDAGFTFDRIEHDRIRGLPVISGVARPARAAP